MQTYFESASRFFADDVDDDDDDDVDADDELLLDALLLAALFELLADVAVGSGNVDDVDGFVACFSSSSSVSDSNLWPMLGNLLMNRWVNELGDGVILAVAVADADTVADDDCFILLLIRVGVSNELIFDLRDS